MPGRSGSARHVAAHLHPHADQAYRDAADFETQARALSGWREALRQRILAVKPPKLAPTSTDLKFYAIGQPRPEAPPRPVSADDRDIPKEFQDPARYVVRKILCLSFAKPTSMDVKVYEGDAFVWSNGGGES
jgi:hypothetical protein